jgi:hypothetical protein
MGLGQLNQAHAIALACDIAAHQTCGLAQFRARRLERILTAIREEHTCPRRKKTARKRPPYASCSPGDDDAASIWTLSHFASCWLLRAYLYA